MATVKAMIHRILLLALVIFFNAQAHAEPLRRDYPGWVASSANSQPSDTISDLVLRCRGEGCAKDTLECVVFHFDAPAGLSDIKSFADPEKFPVGQLNFWMAASIMQERRDILHGRTDLQPSTPLALGPSRISNIDIVSSTSDVSAGQAVLKMYLALWLDAPQLRGLRCSYIEDNGEQTSDRVAELLRMLLKA